MVQVQVVLLLLLLVVGQQHQIKADCRLLVVVLVVQNLLLLQIVQILVLVLVVLLLLSDAVELLQQLLLHNQFIIHLVSVLLPYHGVVTKLLVNQLLLLQMLVPGVIVSIVVTLRLPRVVIHLQSRQEQSIQIRQQLLNKVQSPLEVILLHSHCLRPVLLSKLVLQV